MWGSQQDKSEMSQGVPGTWQILPYSRKTVLYLWQYNSPPKPLSISGVRSTASAFSSFPFSSVVLQCNVTSLKTMSSHELPKDRATVRGHRTEPASTFHSSLQLIPHVISVLTASKNKQLENKSSTKHSPSENITLSAYFYMYKISPNHLEQKIIAKHGLRI